MPRAAPRATASPPTPSRRRSSRLRAARVDGVGEADVMDFKPHGGYDTESRTCSVNDQLPRFTQVRMRRTLVEGLVRGDDLRLGRTVPRPWLQRPLRYRVIGFALIGLTSRDCPQHPRALGGRGRSRQQQAQDDNGRSYHLLSSLR